MSSFLKTQHRAVTGAGPRKEAANSGVALRGTGTGYADPHGQKS